MFKLFQIWTRGRVNHSTCHSLNHCKLRFCVFFWQRLWNVYAVLLTSQQRIYQPCIIFWHMQQELSFFCLRKLFVSEMCHENFQRFSLSLFSFFFFLLLQLCNLFLFNLSQSVFKVELEHSSRNLRTLSLWVSLLLTKSRAAATPPLHVSLCFLLFYFRFLIFFFCCPRNRLSSCSSILHQVILTQFFLYQKKKTLSLWTLFNFNSSEDFILKLYSIYIYRIEKFISWSFFQHFLS